MINYCDGHIRNKRVAIGISSIPHAAGWGTATEAASAMLDHCWELGELGDRG
jgi:[ribosomal protein S5]-alanine N-acetyltransferase